MVLAEQTLVSLEVAPNGNVYVAGATTSHYFPGTTGGAQAKRTDYEHDYCGYISLLSSDLKKIHQTTYLGGTSWNDKIFSMKIAINGKVIAAGKTHSKDFPGTAGGAQEKHKGFETFDADGFISLLSSDLTQLHQSTYLNGTSYCYVYSINQLQNGKIIAAGATISKDFPGTAGGAQETNIGNYNGFISLLSSDLTQLHQSTYLGGSKSNCYIRTTNQLQNGKIIVAGFTNSKDFPGTVGGAQETNKGSSSGFVSLLSSDLTQLHQSTYLGGSISTIYPSHPSDTTIRSSIQLKSGKIIVAGNTTSKDFPGTAGGVQEKNNGKYNGFISLLSSDLTQLHQSTYLGRRIESITEKIETLKSSSIFVAGDAGGSAYDSPTDCDSLPSLVDGIQEERKSFLSGFISNLSLDLTICYQSTYLGSQKPNSINSIRESVEGNIYVAGLTSCPDFPKTKEGAQENHNGKIEDQDEEWYSSNGFISLLTPCLKAGDYVPPDDPPPPDEEVDPNAPRNLRAFPTDSVVHLAWDRNSYSQDTVFNIYRMEVYDNKCSPLKHLESLTNSDIDKFSESYYTDYDVEYDVTYHYYVTSTRGGTETGYSNKASAKRIYPIVLVHGIAVYLNHNPLKTMQDLILSFTGVDMRFTKDYDLQPDPIPFGMVYGRTDSIPRKWVDKEQYDECIHRTSVVDVFPVSKANNHYVYRINPVSAYRKHVFVVDYSHNFEKDSALYLDYDPTIRFQVFENPINALRKPTRGDIRTYAKDLKKAIDVVKKITGAKKVNIVAHSMGGLVSRTYIEEKAFDSDHAKTIYGKDSWNRRLGLPKYDNDVYQLVTCGSPHHGASKWYKNIAEFIIGNYVCADQMMPDSEFLRILNYERDQDFSLPGKSKHIDDKLVNGVYYHTLVGVNPDYPYLPKYDTIPPRSQEQNSIDGEFAYVWDVLRKGENIYDFKKRSDGTVQSNNARLYNITKYKKQNSGLNHVLFHQDHSQILRSEISFSIIDQLLINPLTKIDSKEYWRFFDKKMTYEDLENLASSKIASIQCSEQTHSANNNYFKNFMQIELLDFEKNSTCLSNITGQQGDNSIIIMVDSSDGHFYLSPFDSNNTTENAFVDVINGTIQWYNPTDTDVTYNVYGLGESLYNVRFTSVHSTDNQEIQHIYELDNQFTQENQTDHIHINWDTQEVVFETDVDGDGEIDRTLTPPGAPSSLSASVNFRTVQLSWKGSQKGTYDIKGYQVYRASSSSDEFVPIAFLDTQQPMTYEQHLILTSNGGNGYSFTDTTGLPGESYTYYVTAIDHFPMNSISSNLVQVGPLTNEPSPNLCIWAEANKPSFTKGEEALMVVTVLNKGQANATNTLVEVTIPEETKFLRATRYRSRILTPTTIEIDMGTLPANSAQSFQVDLMVKEAVSHTRSCPVYFDVNCTEKSLDFTHVMLKLEPKRTDQAKLYIGLYYRNAQWDPENGTLYISQETPLEMDFVLSGAQLPFNLTIDWGDGQQKTLSNQRDIRKTFYHQFNARGTLNITVKVTDQSQRYKEAKLSIEVK